MRWSSSARPGWMLLIFFAGPAYVFGQMGTVPGALVPAFPPDSSRFHSTPPPVTSIMSHAERRITKKLSRLRDWKLDRMTIAQFAALLNEHVPCHVDEKALKDVGLSRDLMLDAFHGDHLSTRSVMQFLLDSDQLTWTVQDGCLVLTTWEGAEDNLRLLVLPVTDLVETPGLGEEGYDYDSLYVLITSTVDPSTWDEGNHSPISTFSGVLILGQSWPISHHIEALLNTLRRVKKNETNPDKQLHEIASNTYVSVYRLADGVPVRKTIRLLRQLVPDAKSDELDAQQPTYIKPFGQAILVCHTRKAHCHVQSLLNSLGLCPIPTGMSGSTGMGDSGPQ